MTRRIALVIGINTYDHMPNMAAPAVDAEAIAQRLERDGEFKVFRLPEAIAEDDESRTPVVGTNLPVTQSQLNKALKQLLLPDSTQHPETVLIYFSGHGLPDPEGDEGLDRGYLLTSDSDPEDARPGLPLAQLQKWLSKSPIKNQIVWLDCCHSGGLLIDVAAVSPGRRDGYNRCFIASSRDYEVSWPDLNSFYSVLTKALLEGLDPTRLPGRWVDTFALVDYVNQALQKEPQSPICDNFGDAIRLTRDWASPASSATENGNLKTASRRNWAIPLQMPPLPEHFVERPEYQEQVKACLLSTDPKVFGTLVVSAIYGLGGIGKSVLAAKLAHEEDVQARFADGILWVTLGQTPDLLPLLSGWIQALGDMDYKPTSIPAASSHLRTLLYDKKALLVVDDVWKPEHLEPFRVGGNDCCVLVTTRETRIPDAHRYDLDVMSPEQALALMTQKLSEPLSATEREQALAFADRVGFLPLALELAATQIEEGVTWEELLEDFRAEVARVEGLDLYGQEDIPDDAKRRKYSLLACFNLSLKQLSTEQLRQFAWLGIVPEDVNLTQDMATTLWQVTPRQAGAILRTFCAKALLLPGAKQAGKQQAYRLHDLMHDLAQRLLTSPPHPTREGELPGLGLTKAEAHSELLERYRAQTQNGQWHTLQDDGYIYAFLTWHMEQAKRPDEVHQLLQETTAAGRNGWYEACDAIGKPAGFVNDLARAWALAKDSYEQAPANALALLFRYALIRTSLNSLASNVPAELLGALVEKQIWQPAQGLAYAQQTQNPWQRAECVAALVPYIPESLLPEVITTIYQIQEAAYRSFALAELAKLFPDYWPEVLSSICQIQDRYSKFHFDEKALFEKANALCAVIEFLPTALLPEALKISQQMEHESDRVGVLIELSKKLPEVLPEALEMSRAISFDFFRANSLWELSKQLPEILPEALEAARQIGDGSMRASLLYVLIEQLPPEKLPETLEITRSLYDTTNRAKALIKLASRQRLELLSEALEVACQISFDYSRAMALIELSKQIPELLPKALKETRRIYHASSRITAFIALSRQMPELLSEALEVIRKMADESDRARSIMALANEVPASLLAELLEVTHQIQDPSYRADALVELSKYFPHLQSETLEVISQIQIKYRRVDALKKLVQQLPPQLLMTALEVTQQIRDESSHAKALIELSKYLPDLQSEALEVTRKIQDHSDRAVALIELSKELPELLLEALESAQEIHLKTDRTKALTKVLKQLPTELLTEALEVIRQIPDELDRFKALLEVSAHKPESLPEALEITRYIRNDCELAESLIEAVEKLPAKLFPEVLEITRQISDESERIHVLLKIIKQLPSELLPEALEVARQINDPPARAKALIELSKPMPELLPEALEVASRITDTPARARALIELSKSMPELLPEALKVIHQIQIVDEPDRTDAIQQLSKYASPELIPEILEITQQISYPPFRAGILVELVKQMPPDLLSTGLEAIRQIHDPVECASVFRDLSKSMPELLPEALEVTRQIPDEFERVEAMTGLVQQLPQDLLLKALEITQQFPGESDRANVLGEVVKQLPLELLPKALEIIETIGDKYYAATAWHALLPRLEELQIECSRFIEILETIAYLNREGFLHGVPDLRNTLMRLGGELALVLCLQAMREVCTQWR
jgi:NTP pyrophosphatase (non-canonical NTP hydrolase)